MQADYKFQLGLLARINYQAIIPNNHLLRRINKVLDLSFVKKINEKIIW